MKLPSPPLGRRRLGVRAYFTIDLGLLQQCDLRCKQQSIMFTFPILPLPPLPPVACCLFPVP